MLNLCFCGEIRKIFIWILFYLELCEYLRYAPSGIEIIPVYIASVNIHISRIGDKSYLQIRHCFSKKVLIFL